MKNNIVVILGPTASGKTKLAVSLAKQLNAEIISADSRQVYKRMDIGTGKDLEEYQNIDYHLIDIIEAGDSYNVAFFQRDFEKAYNEIFLKGKMPILCGGTGMYIEAVLNNHSFTQVPVSQPIRLELEKKSEQQLKTIFENNYLKFYPKADLSTKKRLVRAIEIGDYLMKNQDFEVKKSNLHPIIFGLNPPLEIRRERISKRLDFRLKNGMVEEVEDLLKSGISAEKLIFYGLEYKFVTEFLIGKTSFDEMKQKLEVAIHQFSKRQMTFFRSMERKGTKIHWISDYMDSEQQINEILSVLNDF